MFIRGRDRRWVREGEYLVFTESRGGYCLCFDMLRVAVDLIWFYFALHRALVSRCPHVLLFYKLALTEQRRGSFVARRSRQ